MPHKLSNMFEGTQTKYPVVTDNEILHCFEDKPKPPKNKNSEQFKLDLRPFEIIDNFFLFNMF